MRKILYSATTENEDIKNGYIDAKSNKEALDQLTEAGYKNIKFYDDTSMGISREDLADLDEEQLMRTAELEIKVRDGAGTVPLWLTLIRENSVILVIGSIVLISGIISNDNNTILTGLALITIVPMVFIWRGRHLRRYNRLLVHFCYGEWDESLKIIRQMENSLNVQDILLDLAIRKASIEASNGEIKQALASLEPWRKTLQHTSPGTFESREANVYHAGKDYIGFVESMRRAHELQPDSASVTLDYALAEARLGDIEVTKRILKEVNIAELPTYGKPFLIWVKGIIALKSNDSIAVELLSEAINQLNKIKNNPAVWTTIAVCSGYLALALYKQRKIHEANNTLQKAWPILKVHGDAYLLEEINIYLKI